MWPADSCDSRPTSSGPPTTSSAPSPLVLLAQPPVTLWRPQGAKNTTCPMGSSDSPCGLLQVSCWLRKAFLQRAVPMSQLEEQRALLQSWWSDQRQGRHPHRSRWRWRSWSYDRQIEPSHRRNLKKQTDLSHNSEDSSTLERAPYIQHSLVISKLPYLPPHAQLRIAIGMYASARPSAPPWVCAPASPHGGGWAKSRSLATASRKSRTRLYSYTAIPCLTRSSSVSSSSQPSQFHLYINWYTDQILPSAILTSRNPNSAKVLRTHSLWTRCPGSRYRPNSGVQSAPTCKQ